MPDLGADPPHGPSDWFSVPDLPVLRLRLRFAVPGGGAAGHRTYLGSAWRGAFDRSLRESVCVTEQPSCDGCPLLSSCPYPALFESRTPPDARMLRRYPVTPNPYVLEPADQLVDTGAETLDVGIVLIGRAGAAPEAAVRALARVPHIRMRASFEPVELVDIAAERPAGAWSPVPPEGPFGSAERPSPPTPPAGGVRIRLVSPLRIRRAGRLTRAADFDFRAFAANLLRRVSLLTYFFGGKRFDADFKALLGRAEGVAVGDASLRWRDWTRHSSRQGAYMRMGGLIGDFRIEAAELGPLWPLLWLGQWVHAGKACTMGLGRYLVEPGGGRPNGWAGPARL